MMARGSSPRLRRTNLLCLALFFLGLLQIIGTVLHSPHLRGVGMAWMVSPFPKVFSDADGLETFASAFSIHLKKTDGTRETLPMTPEFYAQLKGPYKRRNVYGAALSYAPRLPEPLWQSVFCYGFKGPLRDEFRLPPETQSVAVEIVTHTRGRNHRWILEAPCLE